MKYPFINKIEENSALGKIAMNIERGAVILECGCASGYMTKHLKENMDCQVYIVEYDSEGYNQAIEYAEEGVCGDLMDFEWVEKFRNIKFDYIIFADVLEHLLNPQKVLSEAAKLLKEEGIVFVSLPNIGHNDIVSKIISGRWDYTKMGLLDDSHIHFWGAENLEELANESGLRIILKDYVMFETSSTEQYKSEKFEVSKRIQEILNIRLYGEVYQFVLGMQKEEYVEKNYIICKDKFPVNVYNEYLARCAKQAESDKHLREQSSVIKRQREQIEQLVRENEKKNIALANKNAQLEQIVSSRTWRYGRKLATSVRKVFKPGSALTKTVATPARAMLNLGRETRSGIAKFAEQTKYLNNIVIPTCEQPEVSIIIPVYNQFSYTYDCIRSVVESSKGLSYEVILADDCSTDLTKMADKLIKGLRVVRNEENLRFVRNCNNAAKAAHGRYLLFLNNDTEVHPGWLSSLLQLMESDDTIGIAGSKILSADGTLQEAGGIIWKDASGWNYGRGGDPSAPEYNYVKDVDYISGCSIMVRSDFWYHIGGFDERFAPAYYEDADLAFQARANGYRVVYQPLSVITHFEGISNGTDLSSGQKKYQAINHKKFREKWSDVLLREHFAPEQHILRARDRGRSKKIVLIVDENIPTFDRDAGSRAIYYYVKLFLANNYHVILIPDDFVRSEYASHYEQMGVEVLYGEWYKQNWKYWVIENYEEFDLIFLHRPGVSVKYMDFLRKNTEAKILYYGADLHFLREMRQYEITGDEALLKSSANWREIELELMRKADCALYPSIVEEAYINKIDPSINVMTLPMYVLEPPVRDNYDIENRNGLLFVGGFLHKPNVDAMLWFVKEVFPAILNEYPEIVLNIAGSNPPIEIMELENENIVVHGYVSDEQLEELYKKSRIAVVPLRYGAGMKGKVVQAMEKGLPVVTTNIGAEGFSNSGNMLEIANETEDFAAAVCRLYDDADRLSHMREKGFDYIEEHFSSESAKEILKKAINMS